MRERTYHVYILASLSRRLYVGVTGDLSGRVWHHRHPDTDSFTARYHVDRLVWYEATSDIHSAISREKEIKGWGRKKKMNLIESVNASWEDLSERDGFMDWTRERRAL
jgi:putative endonuclease